VGIYDTPAMAVVVKVTGKEAEPIMGFTVVVVLTAEVDP
jgi:hypothetical protein